MNFGENFPHVGMALQYIRDQVRGWNNEFFYELFCLVGVKIDLSTGDHTQSNGRTERGNEVIMTGPRHFTAADQRNWDDGCPLYPLNLLLIRHIKRIYTAPPVIRI